MTLRSGALAGALLIVMLVLAGGTAYGQSEREREAGQSEKTAPEQVLPAPPPGMLVNPPTPMIPPAPGNDVPGCSVRNLKPLDLLV